MVAMFASGLGVRTPGVAALATAEPNAFVLAYEAVDGRSLDRLDPTEVTDDLLQAIWTQVGELHLTASPIAICGWPTSSWRPTARCG